MRFSTIFYASVALSFVTASPPSHAAHGRQWARKMAEIRARADNIDDSGEDSFELIGDLVSPGPTSKTGKTIANILLGNDDPESDDRYLLDGLIVPRLGSSSCAKDTCCVWKWMSDEMEDKFKGRVGRCNKFARYAVRAGFHDAGTWEKNLTFGGADGSLVLAGEISRPENKGLEEIVAVYQQWFDKYKQYGVSMADIIQMSATVATVVCPFGPRIRSFVGRKDSFQPSSDGLLPDVNAPADDLIALFERKTIRPHGLTALVGAHTTSQQRFADPARALDPQDGTPGVWDVLFYGQTLDPNAPKRIFRFPSDVKFSTHPRMAQEWKEFAGKGGQDHWNEDFAREYIRLSLLGVFNINDLTECTEVLLRAKKSFLLSTLDASALAEWLSGKLQELGAALTL